MEPEHEPGRRHVDDEGPYEGEIYGANSRFEPFWWAVTWLTVPLFVAYLVYRVIT